MPVLTCSHVCRVFFLRILVFEPVHAIYYDFHDESVCYPDNPDGGCNVFKSDVTAEYAQDLMNRASEFALSVFGQSVDGNDRKPYDSFTLVVKAFRFAQQREVGSIDGNSILINADYLENYRLDVRYEFKGIVYHHMARVWQWYGDSSTPRGLITGIADYVRIKAGAIPPRWRKMGWGSRWDEGYSINGNFLYYCDETKPGFIANLNRSMKERYSEDYFRELLGKSVDDLWKEYNAFYAA